MLGLPARMGDIGLVQSSAQGLCIALRRPLRQQVQIARAGSAQIALRRLQVPQIQSEQRLHLIDLKGPRTGP